MNIKQEYIPTNVEKNFVKVELYYVTGKGYFVAVRLVKHEDYAGYTSETFTVFNNGGRMCLLPCTRKSKASEKQALALYTQGRNKMLDGIRNGSINIESDYTGKVTLQDNPATQAQVQQ